MTAILGKTAGFSTNIISSSPSFTKYINTKGHMDLPRKGPFKAPD